MRSHSAHARESLKLANARVAPRLWLHGAICFAGALILHDSTPALIGFTVLYAVFYIVCYRSLMRSGSDGPPAGLGKQNSRHAARR